MQCKIAKRLRRLEKKKEDQAKLLESKGVESIWATFIKSHVKAAGLVNE